MLDVRKKRKIAITLLSLSLGLATYVIVLTPFWGAYIEFVIWKILIPLKVFELTLWLVVPISIISVMVLPVGAGVLIGSIARPHIRVDPKDEAAEYLKDVNDATTKLKDASKYFYDLLKDIENQSLKNASLKKEVIDLKVAKNEDISRVNAAMKVAKGNQVITHIFAYALGVVTSISAAYIVDYLKITGKWI